LAQYFKFDREARKLSRLYKTPRTLRRTAQQYLYYRWRFAGDVVLFQVGRFFEFYANVDDEVARLLGLKPMGKNSRRARYGFPVRAAARYLDKLLKSGRSVVLIGERDVYFTGIRIRLPVLRLEWRQGS
jgi:MutS domain I